MDPTNTYQQQYDKTNAIDPEYTNRSVSTTKFKLITVILLLLTLFGLCLGYLFIFVINKNETINSKLNQSSDDYSPTMIPSDWKKLESKTCHIAINIPPNLNGDLAEPICYFSIYDPQKNTREPLFELGLLESIVDVKNSQFIHSLGSQIVEKEITINGYTGNSYYSKDAIGGTVQRGVRMYSFIFKTDRDNKLNDELFHTLIKNIYFTGQDVDYNSIPSSVLEQYALTRNNQRRYDIKEIANALVRYEILSELPIPATETTKEISSKGIDLCEILLTDGPTGRELAYLPADPSYHKQIKDCSQTYQTGYYISVQTKSEDRGELTITAPKAELNEKISETRTIYNTIGSQ